MHLGLEMGMVLFTFVSPLRLLFNVRLHDHIEVHSHILPKSSPQLTQRATMRVAAV
jgi:hypothetical protein